VTVIAAQAGIQSDPIGAFMFPKRQRLPDVIPAQAGIQKVFLYRVKCSGPRPAPGRRRRSPRRLCFRLCGYDNDETTLPIAREKAMKEWKRQWKLTLIEATNPDWRDLYEDLL
jgi:hypothetical protein